MSRPSFPYPDMATFLTVKEAAKLIGKSPSSIRRIFYPILEKDQHPDRKHIEPSPAEAKSLRVKGENFAWKISEELLRREVPAAGTRASGESKPTTAASNDGSAVIIELLRREMDVKNRQIETQTELLKELNERLREGNILMGTLQRQLALPDAATRSQPDVVDAEPEAAKAEKGSGPDQSSAPKKRRLFDWLFIRL